VREHGLVDSASGVGLHGHVCWPYDNDADMRRALCDFLADGVRLRQRVVYVGSGSVETLREDLEELPQRDGLVEMGMLQILFLDDLYELGQPTDPEAQLATYAAATDRAVADGYTGLRVGAAVTALVEDPAAWAEHTRWESLADRYMAHHPLAALCCYDTRVLPERIVSDLASVHPAVHRCHSASSFRVFAREDRLALEGEIDYFSVDSLRRALAAAAPADEDAVLDLSGLAFTDHHGVLALADETPERLSLRNIPPGVSRVAELLDVALPSPEGEDDDEDELSV
jgi:hypothetical protein